MNTILPHIQYLIVGHDCVVVPGFGAFVACYRGAGMTMNGRAMAAPGREIGFNSELLHDDGLLISSLSRREGITYEAARSIVEQEVESMRRILDSGAELHLNRIGVFNAVEGAGYSFEPEENCIAGIAYASLPAVTMPQILRVPTIEADDFRPSVWRRRVASTVKYAAAVAVLAVIGFIASTPMPVNPDVIEASMSLPAVTAPLVETPRTAAVGIVTSAPKPAHKAVIPVVEISDDDAETFGCYVVIASCASRREAERFMSRAGNENPMRVLHRDGRYRVYVAAGNDYAAAYEYKTADADFARRHPDAWVYEAKK